MNCSRKSNNPEPDERIINKLEPEDSIIDSTIIDSNLYSIDNVMISQSEDSFKNLEAMQKLTEEFFKSLEIPFRVIEICSGDLGDKVAKQYDIEAWFPRQKAYKEVTSAGNCTDYQARKLNIKYTDGKEKNHVHLLNNTMVATSRAMVAILENHQQKNGSVKIPKVLHKYLNFKEIKPKK